MLLNKSKSLEKKKRKKKRKKRKWKLFRLCSTHIPSRSVSAARSQNCVPLRRVSRPWGRKRKTVVAEVKRREGRREESKRGDVGIDSNHHKIGLKVSHEQTIGSLTH